MVNTTAMMQPYLFPYLGYFQLIAAADIFVLGDNLQYTKNGWINRNKILHNGEARLITFPLKKAGRELAINQRQFSDNFQDEMTRLLKTLAMSYAKAPYCATLLPLLERLIRYPQNNLALYAEHSIRGICTYLGIATPIVMASKLPLPSAFDKQDRVIQIAKYFEAKHYINFIGGLELYCPDYFARHDLQLHFHRINDITYRQLKQPFVANLSIIDVLMFNSVERVQQWLSNFSLEAGKVHNEARATSPHEGLATRTIHHAMELQPCLSQQARPTGI
jgi:hypothetical protein